MQLAAAAAAAVHYILPYLYLASEEVECPFLLTAGNQPYTFILCHALHDYIHATTTSIVALSTNYDVIYECEKNALDYYIPVL